MKTLITAASDARAHRLKNSLIVNSVILGDYLDLPEIMISTGRMLKLPDPAQPSYAHKMLALCLDREIDTVYALRADEGAQLHEATQLFSEYGIAILYNDEV